MLQHLLCFLCPQQASAAPPDQRQELGREAEGTGRSGRTPVASLSGPDPPSVEGRVLPTRSVGANPLQNHVLKMEQAARRRGETLV